MANKEKEISEIKNTFILYHNENKHYNPYSISKQHIIMSTSTSTKKIPQVDSFNETTIIKGSARDFHPSNLYHHPLSTIDILFCGFTAGCITRSLIAPLDVAKVVLQLQGVTSSCCTCTLKTTILHIYKNEGILGLWKGNMAGCYRLAPYSATKFFVYDSGKDYLQNRKRNKKHKKQLTNWQSFLLGAFAGIPATLVSYPMEIIRTNFIVHDGKKQITSNDNLKNLPNNYRYKCNICKCFYNIYNLHGIKGLYRGSLVAIMGVVPFEGIQFGIYELFKRKWLRHRHKKFKLLSSSSHETSALNSFHFLTIGSLAGMIAQTVAYPLDTIKKRLQADSVLSQLKYKNFIHCSKTIYKEHGTKGFYRGALTNLIRIIPYSALMFASYENLKKAIVWLKYT